MKPKSFILSLFLSLILISCDSTLFIEVDLSGELSNEDYSLIDYDFVLANSDNSDKLYFEFVTNKELQPTTTITFFDESGKVIAANNANTPNDLINDNIEISEERSFAYSIVLENLRSVSLIHEVIIGNQ
ncbi:hypothetical protein [Gracilimonas sp.]|uniref:hypothetical protein n=1 Tax=Gracilimonas sp. TaxID=1974203 RepID=UPI0028715041|nr:hypothetical protein [Gracilimonas sp.]